MSNYCPAPARFNHRASGLTFMVTARPSGRGYDVEFRKARKSLGTLRDVRPPQCRVASNAHKSDDRLVIEAAISFATCGPRGAGHTAEEIAEDTDITEWQALHDALGGEFGDVPADRYNECGEGVYWLEARN